VQFAAVDQPGKVTISQMVSEPLLLERAAKLENAMTSGQQVAFCMEQANSASSPHLRTLWRFLSAEFTQNPRSEVLTLLGYSTDQFSDKVCNALHLFSNLFLFFAFTTLVVLQSLVFWTKESVGHSKCTSNFQSEGVGKSLVLENQVFK
jgi:hypothetical protein